MNKSDTFRITLALVLLMIMSRVAHAEPMDTGKTYQTEQLAAAAALADAELSIPGYEAASTVYACQGINANHDSSGMSYGYAPINTNHNKTGVDVVTYAVPGCVLVAAVHTHPKRDSRFSAQDVMQLCSMHVVGYIKPAGSAVRMFDCSGIPEQALRHTDTEAFRVMSRGHEVT